MKIEANITPTTSSPALTPRAAQAVAVAKTTAQRLAPAETAPPDAVQKIYQVKLPDAFNDRVQLNVDKETGLVIGTVIDRGTGKVLRQIPSEDMVRFIRATREELGPLYDVKT
jgi:uncharacterized FlaG/YvyC family protein